jgi:hypothetical protein
MKSYDDYVSTAIFPPAQLLAGILGNIKNCMTFVNNDFGTTWKVCIAVICILFIFKMIKISAQKKIVAFFVSVLVIVVLCIMSFGVYIALERLLYAPRGLYGFGIFLAIIGICVVSNGGKVSMLSVLVLNWCFFVFAFSYGNALADQKRYTEFHIEMLLHDLSALYPNRTLNEMPVQIQNTISFAPSIKNISKHYPIIERLVPQPFSDATGTSSYVYLLEYFNWGTDELRYNNDFRYPPIENIVDLSTLDLPVVFDSYYHTIKSDGERLLIVLKH